MICHLKHWRKKRGFTQSSLAAHLKTYGIDADASYISRLETMVIPNPSIYTVLILADALGCLAEDLYSLE